MPLKWEVMIRQGPGQQRVIDGESTGSHPTSEAGGKEGPGTLCGQRRLPRHLLPHPQPGPRCLVIRCSARRERWLWWAYPGWATRKRGRSGPGQCGQRPEPWGPAASCGVGGMELKDPPALAGGPSENPWGAEKVISLLRMLPEEQEAQRLSNGRHDEVMSLAQLATRSRVRSPCGPLFGRFCKEAAHCFRASQAALRLRIRLPVQERGSIPGS